jgi:hypothetical protein
MRDKLNNQKVSKAFAYASRTASANGEIIDTRGFDSLTFVIQLATVTTADATNFFTFTLQHGDDSGLSDAATVTAATGLLGSNLVVNDANTQSDMIGMMGYTGGKRYVRLVATETLTASAAFSAVAVQELPHVAPVGDQAFA